MKLLIISDIHGNYDNLNSITNTESFDKLVILGDLLSYYGNDNKDKILNLLERYKSKLILIKGNCDYMINYELYNLYPYDIITLPINNNIVTITHGDTYKKGFLPDNHGNIIITGHTHIPSILEENNIIYANPGSISIPKGMSDKSYLVFDNNKLILKKIDGTIIKSKLI